MISPNEHGRKPTSRHRFRSLANWSIRKLMAMLKNAASGLTVAADTQKAPCMWQYMNIFEHLRTPPGGRAVVFRSLNPASALLDWRSGCSRAGNDDEGQGDRGQHGEDQRDCTSLKIAFSRMKKAPANGRQRGQGNRLRAHRVRVDQHFVERSAGSDGMANEIDQQVLPASGTTAEGMRGIAGGFRRPPTAGRQTIRR